jgi:hypothetical protein
MNFAFEFNVYRYIEGAFDQCAGVETVELYDELNPVESSWPTALETAWFQPFSLWSEKLASHKVCGFHVRRVPLREP